MALILFEWNDNLHGSDDAKSAGGAMTETVEFTLNGKPVKLEADPEQPKLILTEAGVGYRLQPAEG